MADKKKTFMGQPLRMRRDYSASRELDDDEDKTEVEYDRYGSPKDESGKVVTPAEEKVSPEDVDYDSFGKGMGRGPGPHLRCPFCAVLRRFDPEMLKKDTTLVCSSCKGEVPTKAIHKTASFYRAD
jgi:hypothetical protein